MWLWLGVEYRFFLDEDRQQEAFVVIVGTKASPIPHNSSKGEVRDCLVETREAFVPAIDCFYNGSPLICFLVRCVVV